MMEIDRHKVDPKIIQAAEGFEAMFLDYLMKTMRQTVPKNEMDLENGATEIYRGMLDTENAKKAVHAGGVGLADQIIAYLDPQSYNLQRGMNADQGSPLTPSKASDPTAHAKSANRDSRDGTSSPVIGGTHEGQ